MDKIKNPTNLVIYPKFQKNNDFLDISADYFDIYNDKNLKEENFLCIFSQEDPNSGLRTPLSLDYLLHFWYQIFKRAEGLESTDINIILKNGYSKYVDPHNLPESIFGYVNRKGTFRYKTKEEVINEGSLIGLKFEPYTVVICEDEKKKLLKQGFFEILNKEPLMIRTKEPHIKDFYKYGKN